MKCTRLGPKGAPALWLSEGKSGGPVHIAFAAKDRAAVRAFYVAALPAGGQNNGEPGLMPKYHANYYGGFVKDPDGNNIEAVCHQGRVARACRSLNKQTIPLFSIANQKETMQKFNSTSWPSR